MNFFLGLVSGARGRVTFRGRGCLTARSALAKLCGGGCFTRGASRVLGRGPSGR